jgi:hypothetical protein
MREIIGELLKLLYNLVTRSYANIAHIPYKQSVAMGLRESLNLYISDLELLYPPSAVSWLHGLKTAGTLILCSMTGTLNIGGPTLAKQQNQENGLTHTLEELRKRYRSPYITMDMAIDQ